MSAPKTSPTVEHDDFMEPAAAAKDLKCSERWLRDGANHRGFPHHRLGKSLQFSRQDRAEIRAMNRQPARFRSKPRPAARAA
ncbi:hypothetical protein OHB04_02670 [Streptomyces sp. NBC_01775]|uniref:hypothetical protein n=1 Tax=Streptomyces sp. NBC_01775 TaxID=2975939 RepID=UPI002DDC8336|nr:hypothetical protein [Streptomyces sp. NBC_01775]WSB74797.1 hypothetical protein OHB04_02670 [Streptomyces sp. NBC_01775]